MREFAVKVSGKLSRFLASKDKSIYVDKFLRKVHFSPRPHTYEDRLNSERDRFDQELDVNALPPIFHYWSHTHLKPLFDEFDITHPDDWFAEHLYAAAAHDPSGKHRFASIGAGNCDTEVRVAVRLKQLGLQDFVIECLDLSASMLDRGKAMAIAEGVGEHLCFVQADLNGWRATHLYSGFMANQSLHHIVNLEQLFAEVRVGMAKQGAFVISDIIGRNGHLRWPESLDSVHAFWRELPDSYRYNRLLDRHEELYENWDCSHVGFEGVRAQDILPLLLENFNFHRFIGFGNVMDPFVDRAFGHNFNPELDWDRDFIDRIHAHDESGFADGSLTPTHMFAVVTTDARPLPRYSRGISPEASVRNPAAGFQQRLADPVGLG